MSWNTERNPEESGNYIVSVEKTVQAGKAFIKALAYFDFDSQSWFKYDPFADQWPRDYKPLTDGIVIAWYDNIPVFIR